MYIHYIQHTVGGPQSIQLGPTSVFGGVHWAYASFPECCPTLLFLSNFCFVWRTPINPQPPFFHISFNLPQVTRTPGVRCGFVKKNDFAWRTANAHTKRIHPKYHTHFVVHAAYARRTSNIATDLKLVKTP